MSVFYMHAKFGAAILRTSQRRLRNFLKAKEIHAQNNFHTFNAQGDINGRDYCDSKLGKYKIPPPHTHTPKKEHLIIYAVN